MADDVAGHVLYYDPDRIRLFIQRGEELLFVTCSIARSASFL
jgi:hypothetical protein